MKKYAVYTHSRKDNGEIFYVGCCSRRDNRKTNGVKKYQRAFDFGLRRPAWFKIMEESGGVEVDIVFSSDNREDAFEVEAKLVEQYGRIIDGNGILANECAGGNGAPNQPNSRKTRLKKSLAQIGRRNSMYGKRGSGLSRKVRDIENENVYKSVSEAAEAYGYKMKTLYNWLTGHRKNPTTLRFV